MAEMDGLGNDLVRQGNEAVDDPLGACLLEIDFQLVAFLPDHLTVTELLVEHALSLIHI